tara:strand:+ start:18308 stop:18487 length:180 start_codon:yes stop_codon:yes gene_type:complete
MPVSPTASLHDFDQERYQTHNGKDKNSNNYIRTQTHFIEYSKQFNTKQWHIVEIKEFKT